MSYDKPLCRWKLVCNVVAATSGVGTQKWLTMLHRMLRDRATNMSRSKTSRMTLMRIPAAKEERPGKGSTGSRELADASATKKTWSRLYSLDVYALITCSI